MIYRPFKHTAILPYHPYLFKMVDAVGDTYYSVGVMDLFGGIDLQKYQYLADCITHYVEIKEE